VTHSYIATMVRLACEGADAHGSTLFLVDGEVLRPYVIYNLPKQYIMGIGAVRVGTQCCGRAVKHKKPWIVSDMLTDPLFADGRTGALTSPIRAGFSVPVLRHDRAIGALACHFTVAHEPRTVDIERNEVLANLIGIALDGVGAAPVHEPLYEWCAAKPA
jgi:GAF domain-containing protein